jgi:ribonuclease R
VNADTLIAVVQKRGKFWAAEPYFPPRDSAGVQGRDGASWRRHRGSARRRIVLASNRVESPGTGRRTVGAGELALIRIGGRGSGGKAKVVRAIGCPDVALDAIEALMLDRGLARTFAPGVLAAAEKSREEGAVRARREVEQGVRRDLRDLPTLTIDPATAKDYDDAISAQRLEGPGEGGVEVAGGMGAQEGDASRTGETGGGIGEGRVRVWVHIADVAAYVTEGSPVDREARRRGTSVYVPGKVESMLPQALSNDACSLLPGAERATVTVEMDFAGARIVRAAFYRSLIRSDVRLDYDRVDRIFTGDELAQEPWSAPLQAAREVSAALAGAREQAGGLVLDTEEPEVVFDEAGNVSEIRASLQTESHRLIEYLMIAANEAVARHLAERKVACLYRVHERPEPERVKRLIEQLASLGVPTPAVPDRMSYSQAAELMGEISQRVERYVQSALDARNGDGQAGRSDEKTGPWGGRIGLTSLVLRSLKQACYSPRNIGHAGLHSSCYCHFTSPIRRYPDLVCHRALISTFDTETSIPAARDLGALGEWCSEREREAMRIERDADDLARCYALEQALYEDGWERTFTGEVRGLISAGAFVSFGGVGAGAAGGGDAPRGPLYEGMLPVRRMHTAASEQGRERVSSSREDPPRGGGRGVRRGRVGENKREWWELNEQETILHGERTGQAIRLGDPISVRIARVDTVRGRVDLARAG